MKVFRFFLLFFLFLFFLKIESAQTAELYFFAENELYEDNVFEIKMYLKSSEVINALEGEIYYPTEYLELNKIIEADSLLKLWIKPAQEIQKGKIFFAGIIPGGWQGEVGRLLTLEFKIIKAGEIEVIADNLKLFKHNKKSELANISTHPLNIKISLDDEFSSEKKDINLKIKEDLELPETFTPVIAKEPFLNEGKPTLIFFTQDKLSGLDYFAIKEARFKFLRFFKGYKKIESPYILKDKTLSSYIYLQAVDRAGNKRLVIISPENNNFSLSFKEFRALFIFIPLLVILSFKFFKKRTS